MKDEHSARCIFATGCQRSPFGLLVQLSLSSRHHGLCSAETNVVAVPAFGREDLLRTVIDNWFVVPGAGLRLRAISLESANIGQREQELPWL